jgi:haloalkane dehalogenase
MLTFDPGEPNTLLVSPDMTAWCAANISALEIQNCGPAGHLAPEDQPTAIAAAITSWADRHHLR